jgi:hypothetical protein
VRATACGGSTGSHSGLGESLRTEHANPAEARQRIGRGLLHHIYPDGEMGHRTDALQSGRPVDITPDVIDLDERAAHALQSLRHD